MLRYLLKVLEGLQLLIFLKDKCNITPVITCCDQNGEFAERKDLRKELKEDLGNAHARQPSRSMLVQMHVAPPLAWTPWSALDCLWLASTASVTCR